jgi:AraC-like DNA-binding protein
MRRVSKAIQWIREHFNEPLRIEQLARFAGMGGSTFHHHFRSLTTMSPMQYQKQLRLHEAPRCAIVQERALATLTNKVAQSSKSLSMCDPLERLMLLRRHRQGGT